jgi:hypothetical protein
MKKTMAYKSKGMKLGQRGEAHSMDQSKAPATKPSMQHKEPAHPVMPGDQSMAPAHRKAALPMQDAPPGVAGVNGGSSVALPKSGGLDETEV